MPGDAPNIPSAQEEAQAQIALERERAKLDADRAAADRQRAEADKADKIAKATGKQAAGYEGAVSYGNTQAANRGYDQQLVDQYGVGNLYRSELDRVRRGFAEDDTNPMYGERTLFDDAVSQGTNRYRNDLNKQFDQFAGDGFSSQMFADTADDSILESILGSQYGDVMSQIDASRARGTLNDTGYNKALQKLNQQKLSGRSQIEDLGRGVLSGYRSQLDTLAGNERNKIGAADFNRGYDVNSAQGRLSSLRDSLSGRMEGDIYRATDGQSFFDPSSILSYGATQQGFFNPSKQAGVGGDNPLLNAFTDQKKPSSNPLDTGLGNGAF